MSSVVGSLVVNLSARTAQFSSGLKQAGSSLQGFAKNFALLSGNIAGLGDPLSGAGIAKFLTDSVRAANEAQQAQAKLGAVLRATGRAAGLTAGELTQYASQLQNVTNFEDDATTGAMAVLATFKEIKGDVFKDAVASAQDLSAVMGTDLQSSVVQIGKALNDPIKGISALTRVGVSFTESQKEQIKALQESGDLMGAQRVILAELKSEFGGAAQAMADPMVQLKNTLGDVAENIGAQLLPFIRQWADDLKAVTANVAETEQGFSAIGDVMGWVADAWQVFTIGIQPGLALIAEGFAKIAEGAAFLADFLPGAGEWAADFAQAMRDAANAEWDDVRKASAAPWASDEIRRRARREAAEREAAAGAASRGVSPGAGLDEFVGGLRERLAGVGVDEFGKLEQQLRDLEIKSDDPWAVQEARELIEQLKAADQIVKDMARGKDLAEKFASPVEQLEAKLLDLQNLLVSGYLGEGAAGQAVYQRAADQARQQALGFKAEEQSPLEKFLEQMQQLNEAFDAGLIGQSAYDAAAEQFRAGAIEGMKGPGGFAPVAYQGSREAYERQYGEDQSQYLRNLVLRAEQQLMEAKTQTALLREMTGDEGGVASLPR